ncbi:acyltransferase [Dactylosporangium siamense]|uniref:Acyltransferase n=2 Tax=Dactylosporangium siamense TaxID=685454 RepID=A0A919UE11_9ACTN|nr:acyltransferase [Dactylosporangium siamense]GIG47188.1 acyltransferase [Dactylosporangium siamense]
MSIASDDRSGSFRLSRERLPSLTGMRFIGAFGVFLYHATGPFMFPPGTFDQRVPFATRNVGALALSFFFILTGFVLTWSARPADGPGRFWFRRIVKLYPNHFVTFLIMLVLLDFTNLWSFRDGATGVLPSLFLVQSWSPNPYINIGINAVSWSLSVDAFFLLLFPAWLWLLNRIRVDRLWYWLAGVVGLIIAVPFIAQLLPFEPMLPPQLIGAPTSAWQWWFVYNSPATRALECLAGSLAARIILHGLWPKMSLKAVLPFLFVTYTISIFLPINWYGIVAISAVPMILVTVALTQRDVEGQRSFLGHPWMLWLGAIAYAFYLLHRIILEVFIPGFAKNIQWNWLSATGMILLMLALTVGLSWALFALVERPLVRKFSPSDPTGRTPAPEADLSGRESAERESVKEVDQYGRPVPATRAEPVGVAAGKDGGRRA